MFRRDFLSAGVSSLVGLLGWKSVVKSEWKNLESFKTSELGQNVWKDIQYENIRIWWAVPNELGGIMEYHELPLLWAVPQPAINPDFPDGYYRIQHMIPDIFGVSPFVAGTQNGLVVSAKYILRLPSDKLPDFPTDKIFPLSIISHDQEISPYYLDENGFSTYWIKGEFKCRRPKYAPAFIRHPNLGFKISKSRYNLADVKYDKDGITPYYSMKYEIHYQEVYKAV